MNIYKYMDKQRKKNIKYIDNYIFDCLISDRILILNMIAQKIGTDRLFEEGTGIRILFDDLGDSLIRDIKEFIEVAKEKNAIDLGSDSDEKIEGPHVKDSN